MVHTESDTNEFAIDGLMADTEYQFQLRGIYGDEEGAYSPLSEPIKTKKSLGTKMIEFAEKKQDGTPSIHKLITTENAQARNEAKRTKKVFLGMNNNYEI